MGKCPNNRFGIIFDMDGVIIDTCTLHEKSWYNISKRYNLGWNNKINFKDDVFGTNSVDSAGLLFMDRIAAIDLDTICRKKNEIFEELLHLHINDIVISGFRRFFMELVESGYQIALGTSATSQEADFVLKSLNIYPYFKKIINISMVKKSKPHPEVYLKAAEALGICPERCLGFEDSVSGITALNRAGIKCTVVGSTLSYQKLADSAVSFKSFIRDFTEISVLDVEDIFRKDLVLLR